MADIYEKVDDSKVRKISQVETIIDVNVLKTRRSSLSAAIDNIDSLLLEAKNVGVEPKMEEL